MALQFQKVGYRDVLVASTITIASGQTISNGFSCINLSNDNVMNVAAPRQLVFPTNWTTSDVSFQVFDDDTYTTPAVITNADGVTAASTHTFVSVTAGMAIPLIPMFFDAVRYMKIVCNVAQVSEVDVNIKLQPIYQGVL